MASVLSISACKGLVAPSRAATLSRRQQRAARRALATATPRTDAAPPAEPAAAPEQQLAAEAPAVEQRAVAPRAVSPFAVSTFGRMQQMVSDMDREMALLSRAFGMPMPRMALSPLSSMLAEVPRWAAPSNLAAPTAISLAVDVKDAGDALHITADVPGVPAEGLKLEVSPNRVLTISGERSSESRSGSEEEGNLRVERSFGTFTRRLRLPDGVDVEGIKASAKDGVLTISVPKTPQPQPVHIPVQAAARPAADQPAAHQPAEQAAQEPAAPAAGPAQQESSE